MTDRTPEGWLIERANKDFVTDEEKTLLDHRQHLDPSVHRVVEGLPLDAYIHQFVLTDADGKELARGLSTTVNYEIMPFYAERGVTGIAYQAFDEGITDPKRKNLAAVRWRRTVEEAERLVAIWLDCQDGDHRWEIIEEVGTGPVQLMCGNCGESMDITTPDPTTVTVNELPGKTIAAGDPNLRPDWDLGGRVDHVFVGRFDDVVRLDVDPDVDQPVMARAFSYRNKIMWEGPADARVRIA